MTTISEKDFLNSIFPMLKQGKDIIVGPGDDCAAVDIGDSESYFLLAVDQLISTVHFDPNDTAPEEAGAKLINRNISDIASMGGKPLHALVTLAVGNQKPEWINLFYKGLCREADKWDVSICGGDVALLNKTENFVSTLSITGKVKKNNICLRKNACVGDLLYGTGTYGNSYATRHHLNFTPRVKEAAFLASGYMPKPIHFSESQRQNLLPKSQNKNRLAYTTAMMDVSDGLLLDTQRMAEASGVTIKLFLNTIPARTSNLPIQNILSDGEDYELIFTVKPSLEEKLVNEWTFSEVKLTKIGEILPFQNCSVVDENVRDLFEQFSEIGYDHFLKKQNLY